MAWFYGMLNAALLTASIESNRGGYNDFPDWADTAVHTSYASYGALLRAFVKYGNDHLIKYENVQLITVRLLTLQKLHFLCMQERSEFLPTQYIFH